MNIKTMTVCLVCAGALLVSCGSNREKKAGDTDEMEKPEMIGGDKDEHGCIASAGYTWSEVQKDCIRLWEKGVRLTSVKDERKNVRLENDKWTVSRRGELVYESVADK